MGHVLITRVVKLFWQRLRDPNVRDQIFRIISIALILIAVGACVVLVLAFMMQLQLLLVVFSGVLAVTMAFYLFIRLWPKVVIEESHVGEAVVKALEKPKPKPLTPQEYRRQREQAQKMIRDKAAPALAKAIRGYLQQEEMQQKDVWREKRKK